ncbi:MazG-like family protein [Romboutsia sedimentorum]|uniref:MazG-like family protein n=1 Tax=Romboutsia sedimentorum TaxID=1368474 RepID=A0ABT7E6A3_9FIRM|nr:MazG-like family protein [Romboutsia sedimentorum]MDK2562436.1 MazG-like family protein [Romboutsia sedimentorum]MDK2584676.1 MazG-like family protein [Romboutsia sedimentorum]
MKNTKLVNFEEIQKLTLIDKKSLLERALKLSEEVGEVSEAVLSYSNSSGCGYKNKSKEDVIEECLDVIIVASSMISQSCDNNINLEEVQAIYKKKLDKWKSKCE